MAATAEETLPHASPEETLAAESARRPKAASAAIAAAVLTLLGALLALSANRDFPSVGVLEALRERLAPGEPVQPGLVARKVLYYDDHVPQLLLVQLVPALALVSVAFALIFLLRSTKARNPQLSRTPFIVAVAGAVLVMFPTIVGAISLTIDVSSFAGASDQSEASARDVLDSPVGGVAYSLAQLGTFTVGMAFVLTALNAMRVGLLTRFMGVLGIIVGVLFIFPLESRLPLVKVFWLLGLGVLFLGRWPGGAPPAWVTGEAQPWPTQQEIREQRAALKAERTGEAPPPPRRLGRRAPPEPPETPAPEPPPSRPHSSSKKRKRKRR